MPTLRVEEEIHDKSIKEEIKERKRGKTDLQLGKKGITEGFLREVRLRLKTHGVVKIRMLRSFARSIGEDRRNIARRIASETNARLIEVRGNTFILVSRQVKNNNSNTNGLRRTRRVSTRWLQR
jgi:RNA-binding protein